MKILILSCNTGGGHNAAGKAVLEQLEYEGHEGVCLDIFSLAGKRVSNMVSGAYVNIAKNAPRFFGFIYKLGGAISSSSHKSPVYLANSLMAKYLKAYLEKNHFDAIIMPHLYPAETVTYMKRKKMNLPPCVAIATDYTCIPFWEETECDYYIVPHEDSIEENVKRGMNEALLYPYGIPVGMAFTKKSDPLKAKAKLKLPPGQPVYLVMSGSMGFGKIHLFVYELSHKLKNEEQLIIICGNNRKMYHTLKRTCRYNKNIHVTGFTDHVSDYMDACDVIFTKPGGLTSTEALVKNIPIVHTTAIPGCETKNKEFFVSRGLSLASEHVHTQISQGITLVENQEIRNAMLSTQRRHSRPDAAAQIVRLLEQITNEHHHSEDTVS